MTIQIDKYARDANLWNGWGKFNYDAAHFLFDSGKPFLLLVAATLGHNALEMFLKAALIREGMTVFDPRQIPLLDDTTIQLTPSDCVWGHSLVKLARQLAEKRTEFSLSAIVRVPHPIDEPMTLGSLFDRFDPFFDELRYPGEMTKLEDVGYADKFVLLALADTLIPFSSEVLR